MGSSVIWFLCCALRDQEVGLCRAGCLSRCTFKFHLYTWVLRLAESKNTLLYIHNFQSNWLFCGFKIQIFSFKPHSATTLWELEISICGSGSVQPFFSFAVMHSRYLLHSISCTVQTCFTGFLNNSPTYLKWQYEINTNTGVLISPWSDQEGNNLGSMSGTRAISTKSRRELSSSFFSCKARRRRKFTAFWKKH